MKKFISSFIIAILLFSCLGLTTFAENAPITISDDYQKIYIDGETYSRFDASAFEIDYCLTLDNPVELSKEAQTIIKEISLQMNEQENMVLAQIYFKDSSILSVNFIQDEYLDAYNEIVSGQSQEYIIEFGWPEGNTVIAEKTELFAIPVTLDKSYLEWCDYYYVTVQNDDGSLRTYKGALLIWHDNYYYVDFEETGVEKWYDFTPYDHDELAVYKIADAELLAEIGKAEQVYYEDDYGFLYDDDLTESISAVFLVFVFAVIPFAILIVFLISAIRSKTVYKKMFHTIWILSAAELAIFAVIASFVVMLKS